MTASTDTLARYGAAVYATLTFDRDWSGDTFEALKDLARTNGLDHSDPHAARELCRQRGMDPASLGDDAPQVVFGGRENPDQNAVRAAFNAWHDAKTGDSNDTEHQTAAELIDVLCDWAGIEIREP